MCRGPQGSPGGSRQAPGSAPKQRARVCDLPTSRPPPGQMRRRRSKSAKRVCARHAGRLGARVSQLAGKAGTIASDVDAEARGSGAPCRGPQQAGEGAGLSPSLTLCSQLQEPVSHLPRPSFCLSPENIVGSTDSSLSSVIEEKKQKHGKTGKGGPQAGGCSLSGQGSVTSIRRPVSRAGATGTCLHFH